MPIDTLTADVLTEHRCRQEAARRVWGAGWWDLAAEAIAARWPCAVQPGRGM